MLPDSLSAATRKEKQKGRPPSHTLPSISNTRFSSPWKLVVKVMSEKLTDLAIPTSLLHYARWVLCGLYSLRKALKETQTRFQMPPVALYDPESHEIQRQCRPHLSSTGGGFRCTVETHFGFTVSHFNYSSTLTLLLQHNIWKSLLSNESRNR